MNTHDIPVPPWAELLVNNEDPTGPEKAIRDKFVEEYVKDFDAFHAAIRTGFLRDFASDYSSKFLGEPYVQRLIAEARRATVAPEDEDIDSDKQEIINALRREANYHGPGSSHAARVSALSKLTAILGMDAPTRSINENIHRGGVMVVPAATNLEEWEKAAMKSQQDLVNDARK